MVAGFLTIMLGSSAIALDIGSLTIDKRNLQNAADAIALAGAQDLPSESAAIEAAMAWASKNGIADGDGDLYNGEVEGVTITQQSIPGNPNPKIEVTLRRKHEYVFAKILGFGSSDVTARAVAIRTSPGARNDVVPWGVKKSVVDAAAPGGLVTLKYDANNSSNGNFGPIAVDRTGSGSCQASDPLYSYLCAVKYGTNESICSEPAVLQNGCVPTAPECSGAECLTEPGNKVNGTREGVDYRMNNTDPACNDFSEVFVGNGDGTYRLVQECNPFVSGSKPSLRVIIIPIIDDVDHGRSEVTIKSFGLFFLEGYDSGKCTGNNGEIKGRFVKADINTGAIMGTYDPNSSIKFIRLVE